MMATVYLHPRKEESLKRFHPWVFSGAIRRIEGEVQDGDMVRVLDSRGEPLGVGHYGGGSIAVRMLSFVDTEVDETFWYARLLSALRLRQSCGLLKSSSPEHERNSVYRLVHGEGDALPGLVIDVYGQTAVVQAHSMGVHYARHQIARALMQVYSSSVVGQDALVAVYYKSEATLPTHEERERCQDGFLVGHSEALPVWEQGIQFIPDWVRGQKTGFFIDQRCNRALVEQYACGRRVLNAFCYTGGFSLYALRGGAECVDSLDSSAKAMYLTEQHVQLNFGQEPRHRSITQDAFDFLGAMPQDGYDLIILDPPAFAKHRRVLHKALVGYRRINTQAISKIASGGILFTFSCSQAVSAEEFRLAVFTAAASTGRHVRILHQLHQPPDHPVGIYHPEGEYLKGLVLQVD